MRYLIEKARSALIKKKTCGNCSAARSDTTFGRYLAKYDWIVGRLSFATNMHVPCGVSLDWRRMHHIYIYADQVQQGTNAVQNLASKLGGRGCALT
jgi:hypothetical protein